VEFTQDAGFEADEDEDGFTGADWTGEEEAPSAGPRL